AVGVCCSTASFSSRASRATFVSWPVGEELRRRTVFGAMPRFSVIAFRRRVLIGSPPAPERRLIGSPSARDEETYHTGSGRVTNKGEGDCKVTNAVNRVG